MFIRLKNAVLNILFPKFSEIDLVTILALLVLWGREQLPQIYSGIISLYSDAFITDGRLVIFYTLVLMLLAYFAVKIAQHAVETRKMTPFEKKALAQVFYMILSMISIAALVSEPYYPERGLLDGLEFLIILFVTAKSLFAIIAVGHIFRHSKEHIYMQRVTNEQIHKVELVFVVISSIILYVFLRKNNSMPLSVSLAYYYVTTVIYFTRVHGSRILLFFKFVRRG